MFYAMMSTPDPEQNISRLQDPDTLIYTRSMLDAQGHLKENQQHNNVSTLERLNTPTKTNHKPL